MDFNILHYFFAGFFGLLVGATELLTRYKDSPHSALLNVPAYFYIAVNISAAAFALFLIEKFSLKFSDANNELISVLVAGTGAMAFFRSSLFVYRVGDKDIPLGPGIVFQILLEVSDRSVDRERAGPRAVTVTRIMENVIYTKAMHSLPIYCFSLMQNVSADEQATLASEIAQLTNSSTMSDTVKAHALGLALMNIVGEKVLQAAVNSLQYEIKQPAPSTNRTTPSST